MKLANLESVDAEVIEKLDAAGIRSSEELLERAASPDLRAALAATTGVDGELLLRLARMADRMRITGIPEPITLLFDALGVECCCVIAGHVHDDESFGLRSLDLFDAGAADVAKSRILRDHRQSSPSPRTSVVEQDVDHRLHEPGAIHNT